MAVTNSDELYEQILERLLSNVPNDVDKREGSIIFNALSPAALELQQIYEELADVLTETFADTAGLDSLIMRARERGIKYKDATHAVIKGTLTFSENQLTEPEVIGSVFGVENSTMFYEVTSKVSYEPATRVGVYLMRCQEEGTAGNIASGSLLLEETDDDSIPDNLAIASITELYTTAREDEELEAFRARYFDEIQNQAFGGNVADYIKATNEIDAIGAAQILPVYLGEPLHVGIRFLTSAYEVPTAEQVSDIQDMFDPDPQSYGYGIAPIGHIVTVMGATAEDMDIVATATFETGYNWEAMHDTIEAECEAYLLSLRKEWKDGAATISPGALAYLVKKNAAHITTFSCTINGQVADFVLEEDEVPVLHSLTEAE